MAALVDMEEGVPAVVEEVVFVGGEGEAGKESFSMRAQVR